MSDNIPDKPTPLGKLMKEFREKKGWSYARFSEETEKYGSGLSPSYLFRIETGKRKDPTTQSLKVIIQTLGLPFTDVLETLGMENFLQETNTEDKSKAELVLPEELLNLKISLQTDQISIILSDNQKKLLGDMIVDLYKITLTGEPTYFENKAAGYVLKLADILEQDLYFIEVTKEDIQLIFNVGIMVRKYKINKDDIQQEIEKLNFVALSNSPSSFPLILAGESWMASKDKKAITIQDKISEITKSYMN